MPRFIYSLKAKYPVQYIQWRIKEGSAWHKLCNTGEQLSGMDIQQNLLIQLAQDQKGTELLNILVY